MTNAFDYILMSVVQIYLLDSIINFIRRIIVDFLFHSDVMNNLITWDEISKIKQLS